MTNDLAPSLGRALSGTPYPTPSFHLHNPVQCNCLLFTEEESQPQRWEVTCLRPHCS